MKVHVALAPDLGITPAELIAEWNATPESRTLAEARLTAHPVRAYALDPGIQATLIALAVAMGKFAGEILTDALKDTLADALKERLTAYLARKRAGKPVIQVEWVRQPYGGYLAVVRREGQG